MDFSPKEIPETPPLVPLMEIPETPSETVSWGKNLAAYTW